MQKTALKYMSLLLAVLALVISLSACNTPGSGTPSKTEKATESHDPGRIESITEPKDTNKTEDAAESDCEHELMYGVCLICKKDFSGSEGLLFKSNGDGTCRLAGIGSCTDTDIVIPSYSPKGDAVVEISYRAFAWREEIESITIPKSVKVIQKSAFHDCLSLKQATFEGPKGWTVNGEPFDASNPAGNVGKLLDGELWEKQ